MKQLFTLLLLLLTTSAVQSQTFSHYQIKGWVLPSLSEDFIKENQIKSIQIVTEESNPTRGGGMGEIRSGRVLTFDPAGHTISEMEIHEMDTTFVKNWIYTEKGLPSWELSEDRVGNKRYRNGYRFNKDSSIFQIKFYEMLGKEEMMLVNTQQYIYREDKLHVIRSLARKKQLGEHRFNYNAEGKLIDEQFLSDEGELERAIEYKYDAQGRLSRIIEKSFTVFADNMQEYQYLYALSGEVEKVIWFENGELKGTGTYKYDSNGKLSFIQRLMHGNPIEEEKMESIQFTYHNY